MCEMVNHDLWLWVNDLMRFALTSQPPVVPPPQYTAFAVPPLPAFGRTPAFSQDGGELLKIVEETSGGRVAGDGHAKRKASAVQSSPGSGHARKKRSQLCHMFANTGRCKCHDCIFVHDAPPADSSSPAALSGGGGGSSASAGTGPRALTLGAANASKAAGGGGAAGGGVSSAG